MFSRIAAAICVCALSATAPAGRQNAAAPRGSGLPSDADASQAAPAVKALSVLMQSMAAIDTYLTGGELSGIHSEDSSIVMAVTVLRGERSAVRAEARERLPLSLGEFGRKLGDLHAAADAFDRPAAEAQRKEVFAAYNALLASYGDESLAAARRFAERYTCPMHPDVRGVRTGRCAKCGMALDQPVRIALFSFGGTPATQTVQAQVLVPGTPQSGQPIDGVLKLTTFGRPVLITDLRVVHTERIHLLVIDPSLTDYHHLHPRQTPIPGEYAFSFTPRKTGPYRAWADIRTTTTGLQEYAMANVGAGAAAERPADTAIRLRSTAGDLRFELAPGATAIKAGVPVHLKLAVTDAAGKPFAGLEPVMGTFAHVVGFADDYKTVLHTHPVTAEGLTPDRRGGPELDLQLYATRPGFYRLFVQVQVGGAEVFAPFGLEVAPGDAPVRTP